MMGHAFHEGWALLRRRWLISLSLALALGLPLALTALTASVARWSWPLVHQNEEHLAVAVLLHPRMDKAQRKSWIETQEKEHTDWEISEVPPELLAQRLVIWFPYLQDFFTGEESAELPPLVEIRAPKPEEIQELNQSPAIIAIGPTSSVHRALGRIAREMAFLMAIISGILLFVAVLMAGIWTHLEIFRHADEISIMRLVGATEAAIRSPLLIAAVLPGILAGGFACFGAWYLISQTGKTVQDLGLGLPNFPLWMGISLMVIGPILPGIAAIITLARHARNEE